ncbi:hypothetical protein J7W19_31125 [Streptomyces mobaraensis NBRC 13819 = DSM 40847]|uniref:Uncharacterized protein n=2 Tax=Streptomyces mobaraensis TaxID=35621 RepID=A0A5N5W7T0_STRMB|nr:hypothetical protein [Streptomyces mobaraensis]EMF01330.1 hypothetical protein H340_07006 [Streptomyces mobaraensis NBRC 13819 = DSM 40847]KAB7845047.1 hypothetical protein FRZ00_15175 [Streptomyces mobaraensis]QTT77246.1 hypothetical protein J7W19_31125 [Streptomyces mobaraensis NBRC 13819 = DSM 40847]
MVFTALLIPPLLLGLIFALAGYEDRVLGTARTPDAGASDPGTPGPAPAKRHLSIVRDLPSRAPGTSGTPGERAGRRRRHAA